MLPYEETVRIPTFVRSPILTAAKIAPRAILNIDFAPTFLALAGYVETPAFMDGASFAAELLPSNATSKSSSSSGESVTTNTKETASAGRHFLIEYW